MVMPCHAPQKQFLIFAFGIQATGCSSGSSSFSSGIVSAFAWSAEARLGRAKVSSQAAKVPENTAKTRRKSRLRLLALGT